jgi:hypothetical protein
MDVYMGLNAYTLVPEPNSTYLGHTSGSLVVADPMSGPTMGLMMLLSTLQYQAPYMNPVYSNAASQIGKVAFVQSGGQAVQDKTLSFATKDGLDFAHSIAITDAEMGIVGLTLKTIRARQLNLNGPKFYSIKTDLTINQQTASMEIKYAW